MQPCPTCGGMGIDANGYCTQCRTYRGLPQAMPPSSGVPYSGAPYGGAPTYGAGAPAPYAGYPTSPGPTYQQPTSSGPTYQQPTSSAPTYPQPTSGGAAFPGTTYGGAYGAPTTPPPQKRRNSFMVPLLALSGVLAVIVVAIVVVVVAKNSGDSGTPGGGGSTAAALVDECVVGTWEMTSYREDVSVPQVGPVPFTLSGKGATMKFSKDGKGVQDFGSGTTFTGDVTVSGQSVTINLKITGDIKYDFRTNDGVMSYSNLVSTGKATVSAPLTGQSETEDFKGSSDPSKYSCSGDTMTMSTSLYQSELKRTSTTA